MPIKAAAPAAAATNSSARSAERLLKPFGDKARTASAKVLPALCASTFGLQLLSRHLNRSSHFAGDVRINLLNAKDPHTSLVLGEVKASAAGAAAWVVPSICRFFHGFDI